MLDRVERKLVHEVELTSLWFCISDFTLNFHRPEMVTPVKDDTAHDYDTHVNGSHITHLING